MLTREESDQLHDLIMGRICENHGVYDLIKKFTEKPKIRVGDIYKNGWEGVVEIEGRFPDGRYYCKTGETYDENGYRLGVQFKLKAHNLDLSKKYMLVEVEGE